METNYNANFWKNKAVERSKQIKDLKKRITEISRGRDHWKEKYNKQKELCHYYKDETNRIKKNLMMILSS